MFCLKIGHSEQKDPDPDLKLFGMLETDPDPFFNKYGSANLRTVCLHSNCIAPAQLFFIERGCLSNKEIGE